MTAQDRPSFKTNDGARYFTSESSTPAPQWGIYLIGLASGLPSGADRSWLKFFDKEYGGGVGVADGTTDPAEALAFPSFQDAWEFWRQPTRYGRALTAYTVSVQRLDQPPPVGEEPRDESDTPPEVGQH